MFLSLISLPEMNVSNQIVTTAPATIGCAWHVAGKNLNKHKLVLQLRRPFMPRV